MLRRIGVIASFAVTAAMFAGIQGAQAQDAGIACIFHGVPGGWTPIPNKTADTVTPSVERGTYSFSTDGGGFAVCGVEGAGIFVGVASTATGSLTLESDGYYDNVYCGHKLWMHDLNGNDSSIQIRPGGFTVPPGRTITITGWGYEIPFVGGEGPMLIGADDEPATAAFSEFITAGDHSAHVSAFDVGTEDQGHGPFGGDGRDSRYEGRGEVEITPGSGEPPTQPRDNCFNQDDGDGLPNHTNEFQVAGHFVMAPDPTYDGEP